MADGVRQKVRDAGGEERLEEVRHCSLAVDVALLVDGRAQVLCMYVCVYACIHFF